MSPRSIIGIKGLNTSDNPLDLPPGTMVRADNVVVRNRGTIEPRRGEAKTPPLGFGVLHELFSPSTGEAYFHAVNGATGSVVRYASMTALAGNFHEEAGVGSGRMRMKFQEVRDSVFFASHLGVYRFALPDGTPTLAGIPRAPDLDFVGSILTGAPNSGWMPANSQVAGRSVFGTKDANGDIRLGAPSGRLIITNPADQTLAAGALVRTGGNTVTVTFPTAHGYQVGDTFALTLTPADANFVNGNKTVVTVPNPTTLTYTEAGGNVASAQPGAITSGGKNIRWRITLPPDITTSHFFQLHRGAVSATAATPPDDELFQVFEGVITAGDITAGYIDFVDRTPESVLGLLGAAPLYTNPNTGDGTLAARLRPPRAKDIFWWDNRLWYVGTVDVGRLYVTLLGIGSPDGLQNNDTITIDSTFGAPVTFTAKTTPAAATDFQLYADGSASQNIERTARALVAKIHTQQPDVRAYYASADDDAPGRFQLESEAYDDAFQVWVSRPTAWSPALTTSSTGAVAADVSRRKNGLSYSELGLPDAVPITNQLTVGASWVEAMRGVALRDKMLVTTTNGGAWLVSGPFPFRVEPLDPTLFIQQPDTVKSHAGQVFALASYGLVAITEAGARLVDLPLQEDFATFKQDVGFFWRSTSRAFAVSREGEHEYLLFLPSELNPLDNSDPTCHQAFIYNSAFDFWSRRTGERTCGAEMAPGILGIMWLGEDTFIRPERLTEDIRAFADEDFAVTVVSSSGQLVTLNTTAGITPGDMLYQTDSEHGVVEEVVSSTVVRVPTTEAWANGPASLYVAVDCDIQLAPDTYDAPAEIKQGRDILWHFKRLQTYQQDFADNPDVDGGHVNATFVSELMPGERRCRIDNAGWGLRPAGFNPWGDPRGPSDERTSVPQEHQRARQLRPGLRIRQAGCRWELSGYSLVAELGSERSR